MNNEIRIACIGSRDISEETKELMQEIGKFIVSQGWYISSGNCAGSDYAYACGGNLINPAKVILYLPWTKYNNEYLVKRNFILREPKPEWSEIAARHHPAYQYLSQGVKKLMDRNVGIVLRANKLIAYLNHNKKGGGGTGQGFRLAESLNIPRMDISQNQSLAEIKEFLLN